LFAHEVYFTIHIPANGKWGDKNIYIPVLVNVLLDRFLNIWDIRLSFQVDLYKFAGI